MRYARKSVKLLFGHVFRWCSQSDVFGQVRPAQAVQDRPGPPARARRTGAGQDAPGSPRRPDQVAGVPDPLPSRSWLPGPAVRPGEPRTVQAARCVTWCWWCWRWLTRWRQAVGRDRPGLPGRPVLAVWARSSRAVLVLLAVPGGCTCRRCWSCWRCRRCRPYRPPVRPGLDSIRPTPKGGIQPGAAGLPLVTKVRPEIQGGSGTVLDLR